MAARQRRHRPYRSRRGRFGALSMLLSAALVIAAVAVACVVFFRINHIEVEGNRRYSAEEIVEASGIQIGDNLFALPSGRVASNILSSLPYVEGVIPQRVLPDGVILKVTERTAAASVDTGEGRWLISAQGKLLERENGEQVTAVTGLTALAPLPGASIQVAEEEQDTLSYILALLPAMEQQGMLAQCSSIDCTPAASILAEYGIYHVRLPRGGDYDYYLRLLASALASDKMPKDTPGTLDLTITEGRVHFSPDR